MADFWGIITTTKDRYDPADTNGGVIRRRHKNVYGVGVSAAKPPSAILVDVQHLVWQRQAACRDEDRELFFEDEPSERARAICATCPVRQACDDYAIQHRLVGLWGGRTFEERRRQREREMSRARRLAAQTRQ